MQAQQQSIRPGRYQRHARRARAPPLSPGTQPLQSQMASRKTTLLAVAATVGVAALLLATASAKTYVVGDDAGWDVAVDYDAWASGKNFKVGDTLVFRYETPSEKDVVVVDAQGYAECLVTGNARALTSGNDRVVLGQAGQFFFICDAEGECDSGMKLAVNVQ